MNAREAARPLTGVCDRLLVHSCVMRSGGLPNPRSKDFVDRRMEHVI